MIGILLGSGKEEVMKKNNLNDKTRKRNDAKHVPLLLGDRLKPEAKASLLALREQLVRSGA